MRKTLTWLALCAAMNLSVQTVRADNYYQESSASVATLYKAPAKSQIAGAQSVIQPVSGTSDCCGGGANACDSGCGNGIGNGAANGCGCGAGLSNGCGNGSACDSGCGGGLGNGLGNSSGNGRSGRGNGAPGTWLSNTQFLTGVDAYKSLGDSTVPPGNAAGYMNSAGIFSGFNSGFGLGSSRVRGQIGGTYGVYDFKGRDTFNTQPAEQQSFITSGIYKRSDYCCGDRISWGVVYDQFWADQWGLYSNEVYLGQFRAMSGYAVNERNEIGTWATLHTNNDTLFQVAGPDVRIRASNQANVYWKHNTAFGGTTTAYVGGVDRADIGSWVAGLNGVAPLSRNTSLFGNSTFLFPSSSTGVIGSNELQWNVAMGLMYSFGGKSVSRNISGQPGLPLMPVANNGSFLITN